jgi:hypothetical protein
MTLVISKGITLRKGWQPMDADAAAYITAVETADTEPLEEKTKIAIDNFVLGCKADGIWNAIKASCILAGARTLEGALVPLVGAAPTNVGGLFVSGDYNRKTGLAGNGSTKCLDSNRNNEADPQNNNHNAVYVSSNATAASAYLGAGGTDTGANTLQVAAGILVVTRSRLAPAFQPGVVPGVGSLYGLSRNVSSGYTVRTGSVNLTAAGTSQAPFVGNVLVFARGTSASPAVFTNARLSFYSIGESLDLALLDARVTDLINAFAAAIP